MLGGRPVAAQPLLDGAEVVQHAGLANLVAGLPVEAEGLPVVADGRPIAAQPLLGGAEVAQRAGLAYPVAGLPEQGQGLLQLVGGLLVPPQPQVDRAQTVQRLGFAGPVAAYTTAHGWPAHAVLLASRGRWCTRRPRPG